MKKTENIIFPVLVLVFLVLSSCGQTKKLTNIQEHQMNARLILPSEQEASTFRQFDTTARFVDEDTITVNVDGHDMLIMKAVRDDETGSMVATQELNAAVVTARFRNVAERHGRIDLEFQVIVPKDMQDSKWQLRFYPDMFILEDSIRLDNIVITGTDYRKAQLRGYQQYEKFLSKIVSDTTKFLDLRNLEIFLERHLPQVYAFKNDSSYVSDELFESYFGVSEQMAVDHYTNTFAKNNNARRKAKQGKMFRKFVKAPITTEHIKLDTVITNLNGDFVYNYVQTINTRPKLKKVDIILSGEIFEQDKKIYSIPRSEPLTFYISSLSSFVDGRERYRTKIIERKVEANAAWYIDFKVGKSDVENDFGNNRENISFIKDNLRALLLNQEFDLDSITIAASASPEGSEASNNALSARRAASVAAYFNKYLRQVQDSIRLEEGLFVTVGDDMSEGGMTGRNGGLTASSIKFKSRSAGENWSFLNEIVAADENLSPDDKESYSGFSGISNFDAREKAMSKERYYKYLRDDVYPRLRTVLFEFHLHRKGMVKDTIHTTELDTVYMKGVEAIRERDYETALVYLSPYNDYNTAIAYVSLDRNMSAMNILKGLERTAQVNYMLAVLYSREGNDRDAVQCYLTACKQDGSYVHRGNLDPEISALIRKYDLNKEDEDEFDYSF